MAEFIPVSEASADDSALRAALEWVDPPLLAALAQATGSISILRDDLRPDLSDPFDPDAGWTPEDKETIRQLAFEVLVRLRDDGGSTAPPAGPGDLRNILEWMTGQPVDDTFLRFLREEVEVEGTDLRAPGWHTATLAPDRPFTVAVIGAGMSGLSAAYRLQQAGVPYVVIEKNDDVGGTWLENSYPGCRVDVPNHFYSYSFAQRHDWPDLFSPRDTLLDYFRGFADQHSLRDRVRFSTEVVSADWSEHDGTWLLRLRGRHGEDTLSVQAVIVAVGQLNRPKLPDIEGLDTFGGRWFHSARWDHEVDLTGKRVAVIGNGASAAQAIPLIAEQAARLEVYQRTPNWFVPTPDYHDQVPEPQRWLFRHVPFYSQWYRLWLFWRGADALLPATKVDPGWSPGDRSVGLVNEELRVALAAYIEGEFADRPDLLAKVMPAYAPASKRILRDNGIWARTLKRDNVALVTEAIERVTPSGVLTADGAEHEADVIVYATGFEASQFLAPMRITGRGGRDLHAQWGGDARAYLGITVPDFPNLFCLYGPNTNIVVNGSIIFFTECALRYVMGCLRLLLEEGATALDCRQEVHDEYNRRVDEENRRSVWGVATVSSWYRNPFGRVAQNWPFTLLDYWAATRQPERDDYHLLDESGTERSPSEGRRAEAPA